MMTPSPALKGILRGKMIELDCAPELPDGQEVTVVVVPVSTSISPGPPANLSVEDRRRWEEAWAEVKDLSPGEGLRLAFGAWAEDAEAVDQFLESNRTQRRLERRPPL